MRWWWSLRMSAEFYMVSPIFDSLLRHAVGSGLDRLYGRAVDISVVAVLNWRESK